jgi:hypothetical protein
MVLYLISPFCLLVGSLSNLPAGLLISHLEKQQRRHLKWDQKNSLIETRSSSVKGVALGMVSLANRIKSGGVL